MPDLNKIVEELSKLTVVEAAELSKTGEYQQRHQLQQQLQQQQQAAQLLKKKMIS